jgi:hypothetical protein
MKLSTLFALTLLLAFAEAQAQTDEVPAVAEQSTLSWLSLTDRGQYGQSWTDAASLFQAAISSADWVRSLTAARSPLGQLMSREVSSATFARTLPGAPDGEYVVFQFSTSFENKASAVETVTAMKDQDGKWRVAGYFIK